jgi:predicted Zn-dependent peptidase
MQSKTTLTNGIRVVTEFMPDVHSASVGFWVENGSRHETSPLNGISHFLEHMLFKGTSDRTALDIAREADSFGGTLNAFTSREYSCYYAKVLSNRLPEAVDLLSDLVLNSSLDDSEIEKERRVILQEISMVEDTPEDHVHDLFSENIWHRHPLGLPVLGKTASVESITRGDLQQLLNQRYLGNNIIVTAAGKLDHDLFCRWIEAAFSSLPAGQVRDHCDLPLYQPGTNLLKKSLEQVHLCLGCKALPQTHDDRFSLQVLNTILGASMSSRLFQRVREERGLAYSIYSYLNCHSDAGTLVVYCGTAADELQQVFSLIMEQFRSLKKGEFTADEVSMAREQIKGNLLLSLEGSDSRMSRIARNEIYFGYQPELKSIIESLDQVNVDSVTRVAQKIFVADSLTLQAVGNTGEFSTTLDDLTL